MEEQYESFSSTEEDSTEFPGNDKMEEMGSKDEDSRRDERNVSEGEQSEDTTLDSDKEPEKNPWHKLLCEAVNDLESQFQEQVNIRKLQGVSEDIAEVEAFNELLPAYRKRMRKLYISYLTWFNELEVDPVHKEIMKTQTRYMNKDDMDFQEAMEASVNKQKHLLNRLFKEAKLPKGSPPEHMQNGLFQYRN